MKKKFFAYALVMALLLGSSVTVYTIPDDVALIEPAAVSSDPGGGGGLGTHPEPPPPGG